MAEPRVATYSICACDLAAGQWGVATQSKFLAVGSVVPWAEPQVGAIATQSYANPRYGPDGLALLRDGLSAEEVVERLTAADEDRALRQLGVVDGEGRAATFTGVGVPRLGGRPDGRRLRGAGEHPRLGRDGRRPRRDVRGHRGTPARRAPPRLPRCGAGRGRRQPRPAVGGAPRRRAGRRLRRPLRHRSSTCASTTTNDPLGELRRIYGIHDALFGKTPREEWIPVDDALRAEIDERLARVGHETLADWAGVENLEERVDGEDEIDPVVLARLREST